MFCPSHYQKNTLSLTVPVPASPEEMDTAITDVHRFIGMLWMSLTFKTRMKGKKKGGGKEEREVEEEGHLCMGRVIKGIIGANISV